MQLSHPSCQPKQLLLPPCGRDQGFMLCAFPCNQVCFRCLGWLQSANFAIHEQRMDADVSGACGGRCGGQLSNAQATGQRSVRLPRLPFPQFGGQAPGTSQEEREWAWRKFGFEVGRCCGVVGMRLVHCRGSSSRLAERLLVLACAQPSSGAASQAAAWRGCVS